MTIGHVTNNCANLGEEVVDTAGRKALDSVQRLVDEVVMGCLRMNRESLRVLLERPELVDARSTMGIAPLFGACYALWPEGTRRLLEAGADPHEVGFGSALDAVELGLRDAGRSERTEKKACEITQLLVERGLDPDHTVSRELAASQEAAHKLAA